MQNSGSRSEGKSKGEISWGKLQAHQDQADDRTGYGGLGLVHQLARRLSFAETVDEHVKVLRIHQGYQESDHLFHLVSMLFAGGERIEDLSFLQSDEGYRKLMGDATVTDPTTMGDFLRRFGRSDLNDFINYSGTILILLNDSVIQILNS